MFSASFIWEPGEYDAEFQQLNETIDAIARDQEGFVGSESWRSVDGNRCCATYYWRDLDALQAFSVAPPHLEAKRQYARWYRGYQVVISEIVRSYGDGNLSHFTGAGQVR